MENIQVNGQRIWGPPSDWSGPPPPYGTEVFIKNIPEDMRETDLCPIFSLVGEIYEIRLPVHWNGLNRGYAFVRYTKMEYANVAIKQLNKLSIRAGWQITVERSIDNNRLFLSAVPNDKTAEEILNDLKFVVDNVKKVYVYSSSDDPSLYRGYAFVEFLCHRDAAIAKRILTPDVCFNLFERKCIAAWANPLPFLQDNIVETINILFMRNIPSSMKKGTIKQIVEKYIGENTVLRVKRLNDIAFLTFQNHQLAKAALQIIKDNPKFFGETEAQVEVEWAVPRHLACTKFSTQKPLQEMKSSPPIDKKTMSRITNIVEETWKNRLQNVEYLNRILKTESNVMDWKKNSHVFIQHLLEPTKYTDNAIKELVDDMKRKNLFPKDFINNNIISLENKCTEEFEEVPEFTPPEKNNRRKCLQWFEKPPHSWDYATLNISLTSSDDSSSQTSCQSGYDQRPKTQNCNIFSKYYKGNKS